MNMRYILVEEFSLYSMVIDIGFIYQIPAI